MFVPECAFRCAVLPPQRPPLPPTRTVHRAWSDDEIDYVVRLFHRYGPKFRQVSRHVEPSWKNPGFRPGTEDLTEIRGANSTALFGVWAPCSPTSSSCAPTRLATDLSTITDAETTTRRELGASGVQAAKLLVLARTTPTIYPTTCELTFFSLPPGECT